MKKPSFYHHLHPHTIPAKQARFRYTLGAGGISVFLILMIAITGILEMFYYAPVPEKAALSIQTITYHIPYGWLVRNIHYWAAQLLIVTTVLHTIRVIFTGAYRKPRDFNYLLGLLLLVLALFFDFTGYILRWDQGIRWALVTGTNLLRTIPLVGSNIYDIIVGGNQPGPATLIRFYAWHIFGLTTICTCLGVWHLFRVRRDGGIAVPPVQQRGDTLRITRFELARNEFVAAIYTLAILLLIANLFPAPLSAAMGKSVTQVEANRAPWFFLWIQQLLKYGNPFLLGICFPSIIFIIFLSLPYVFPSARREELGAWFPFHNRLAQYCVSVLIVLFGVLTILAIYLNPG